jgi:hypothetical protein
MWHGFNIFTASVAVLDHRFILTPPQLLAANIPCMRFTDKKPEPHHGALPCDTLQIFSLKVAGIREGLQWPLHVFGTVFLRDSVDHNRNPIFDRSRDNCQIHTQAVCTIFSSSFNSLSC